MSVNGLADVLAYQWVSFPPLLPLGSLAPQRARKTRELARTQFCDFEYGVNATA